MLILDWEIVMSDEKMREEFEAAYMKDVSERFRGDEEWIERGSSGEYRSFRAAGAWWAWKNSREAIEVELPESASIHNTEVIKAVGRHIIKQGLKVKP